MCPIRCCFSTWLRRSAQRCSVLERRAALNEKIIRNKLGLLNLAEELGNVSRACRVMGFSRDTFYRYKDAMDAPLPLTPDT